MDMYDEVLSYVVKRDRVNIPALQRALGLDYGTAAFLMEKLVSEKVLRYESGLDYVVISRKPVRPQGSGEEEGDKKDPPFRPVLSSDDDDLFSGDDPLPDEFFNYDDEDDDFDDDDLEDDEDADGEGEEEREEDGESEESDKDDADGDYGSLVKVFRAVAEQEKKKKRKREKRHSEAFLAAKKKFEEIVSVIEDEGDVAIEPFGSDPFAPNLRFSLVEEDGEVFLSDRGEAFWRLSFETMFADKEEQYTAVDRLLEDDNAERHGDCIFFPLRRGYEPVASLVMFYAVVRRISELSDQEIASAVSGVMSAEFRVILGDRLEDDPETTRPEAVAFAKEAYQKVKDGDDYGAIKAHASLIDELCGMDDGTFAEAKARYFARFGKASEDRKPLTWEDLPTPADGTFTIARTATDEPILFDPFRLRNLLIAGDPLGRENLVSLMLASLMLAWAKEDARILYCGAAAGRRANLADCSHLLTGEVYKGREATLSVLKWALDEADRRRDVIRSAIYVNRAARTRDEYNVCREDGEEYLPFLIVVIEDLYHGDVHWMCEAGDLLKKLLPVSSAMGICVILSERDPDATLCKQFALCATFKTSSARRSRAILGVPDAVNLSGDNQMLYHTSYNDKIVPAECAAISQAALDEVVFRDKVKDPGFDKQAAASIEALCHDKPDPVYVAALAAVVKAGTASVLTVQREVHTSYTRAGKIVEWMESKGYIAPAEGSRARQVLLTQEEFDKLYGSGSTGSSDGSDE